MLFSMKSSQFGLFYVVIVLSQTPLKTEDIKSQTNSLNILENVDYGSEVGSFPGHYAVSSNSWAMVQSWHWGKGAREEQ